MYEVIFEQLQKQNKKTDNLFKQVNRNIDIIFVISKISDISIFLEKESISYRTRKSGLDCQESGNLLNSVFSTFGVLILQTERFIRVGTICTHIGGVGLGPKVREFGPKWDTSGGLFQIRFQYILAHKAKMY